MTAKETLRVGDRVTVVADAERRARIMRNHTGTHLAHAALRNILGTHVKQAGSLNAPERLRFDFSHFAPVGQEELKDIEQQVNEEIRLNTQMETGVMSLEEALNSGALAFFGDKYPESNVRVVTIPDPQRAAGLLFEGIVRRNARGPRRRYWRAENRERRIRGGGSAPHRGGYRNWRRGTLPAPGADPARAGGDRLNVGEDSLLASVEKLAHTARQLEKELGEESARVRWTNWTSCSRRPRR